MSASVKDEFDGLPGASSDDVPGVLATGSSGVDVLFISMAERHPGGDDAEYLRWHTLDHRPEQHRLSSVRASLRVVSTPACRAARAASSEALDAIDHVMTYFFADIEGLEAFNTLSIALRDAGRAPFVLKPVQRGVYRVRDRVAAPRVATGADVLPWVPIRGVYLLIEQGEEPAQSLAAVPGVAGVWSALSTDAPFATVAAGEQVSVCFLDGDPVDTAQKLAPVLASRWRDSAVTPLLAAPFYSIVPYAWDRYLP